MIKRADFPPWESAVKISVMRSIRLVSQLWMNPRFSLFSLTLTKSPLLASMCSVYFV